MNRRQLLTALPGFLAGGLFSACARNEPVVFPLTKTRAEWKALLPHDNYKVLFEEVTEFPFSSELDKEARLGTYVCFACNQPLFDSANKFDSGTGWPSFWEVLPGALGTKDDFSLLLGLRKEYHCSRCGGHQGHLFNDGPRPTFKRYCNNGLALRFVAQGEAMPALRT